MGPGEDPRYEDRTARERTGRWGQRRTDREFNQLSSGRVPAAYPSSPGRRDGGEFGTLRPRRGGGYQYQEVYAGEATRDPDRQPERSGEPGLPGFGQLVRGIDNNNGYGYRPLDSRHALADWGQKFESHRAREQKLNHEPYVPGRGGLTEDEGDSVNAGAYSRGYRDAADFGNREPAGHSAGASADMRRQNAYGGDREAMRFSDVFHEPLGTLPQDRFLSEIDRFGRMPPGEFADLNGRGLEGYRRVPRR